MESYIIILLCIASFLAGFIDAVAGGGGLIQTPTALILLPQQPVSSLMGSLKIPGFTGTSVASLQYLKKVDMNWKLLLTMSFFSCLAAFAGSYVMTIVSNDFMKPLLFLVLTGVAIYTFFKKDFGNHKPKKISYKKSVALGILISVLIGFYDGFIGPGTGSFLILAFISILGFDFLHASANAKLVNLASNVGSLVLFISKGKILWIMAIPMAFCNGIGGWMGAKLAIKKGNSFIRVFFLVVVIGTLIRLSYDIFMKA
ncbi:TSUP family transporter [Flavobacterium amniphilum]|uniref:sulfite exporter TauE/SafE family protein n=1 Tax=Flavobacterium amniphilum TaxID=1834035 RepID=UPI00202A34F5|nr:TSUP family transporter [Flavobacterium amniphilum]MCL9806146.1 TSUP family transporter [Flavobacterium amniphilum]